MHTYGRFIAVENDHKLLETITKKSLQFAPRRVQRMLLRRQEYNYQIFYVPVKNMPVADALSRAVSNGSQTKFVKELETVCMTQELRITNPVREKIKSRTAHNKDLAGLMQIVKEGWPHQKRQLTPAACPFYQFGDEVVVEDGILYKGNRCIVPTAVRQKTFHRIHASHMGMESRLRRARDTVYRPEITTQVREMVH